MGNNLTGKIQGVGLDSFLQIVQMDQMTCTLKITSPEGMGVLYFVEGELFAAATGELSKMAAACRIISWEDAVIEIDKTCDKSVNEIKQPLMNILMEGMRLRDEALEAPSQKAAPSDGFSAQAEQASKPPAAVDVETVPAPSPHPQSPVMVPSKRQSCPVCTYRTGPSAGGRQRHGLLFLARPSTSGPIHGHDRNHATYHFG